jgi:Protein of unknown function (DUF2795)
MASTEGWIDGVSFPATKLALIEEAVEAGAPQATLERLQRLEREQYGSRGELETELARDA